MEVEVTTLATMSWEAQSRRVRQVQQRLDAKLTAYSQLVSDAASNSSPLSMAPSVAVDMNSGATSATPDPASLEAEIQALLVQYADAQAELSTLLNDPALPPTQTQLHTVQRHRELLMELERDFFRTKTNLLHALSRKQLLGHVKEDISAYRAQHQSETQAYLDERAHLDRSQRMMDETLEYVGKLTQPSVRDTERVPRAAQPAEQHAAAHDKRRRAGPGAQQHSDNDHAPPPARHDHPRRADRRLCRDSTHGRYTAIGLCT